VEELSVRCGTKWGKMRSEAETRTKVAKKDKADKLIRKTITKNVMATVTAGGLTVPLTPGNATAAGEAIAGAAGSPAAAAAIQAAIAGQ
jgi:hypothetical protein